MKMGLVSEAKPVFRRALEAYNAMAEAGEADEEIKRRISQLESALEGTGSVKEPAAVEPPKTRRTPDEKKPPDERKQVDEKKPLKESKKRVSFV